MILYQRSYLRTYVLTYVPWFQIVFQFGLIIEKMYRYQLPYLRIIFQLVDKEGTNMLHTGIQNNSAPVSRKQTKVDDPAYFFLLYRTIFKRFIIFEYIITVVPYHNISYVFIYILSYVWIFKYIWLKLKKKKVKKAKQKNSLLGCHPIYGCTYVGGIVTIEGKLATQDFLFFQYLFNKIIIGEDSILGNSNYFWEPTTNSTTTDEPKSLCIYF